MATPVFPTAVPHPSQEMKPLRHCSDLATAALEAACRCEMSRLEAQSAQSPLPVKLHLSEDLLVKQLLGSSGGARRLQNEFVSRVRRMTPFCYERELRAAQMRRVRPLGVQDIRPRRASLSQAPWGTRGLRSRY